MKALHLSCAASWLGIAWLLVKEPDSVVDGSLWKFMEAVVKAEAPNGELERFIGSTRPKPHMQEYPTDSGLVKTFPDIPWYKTETDLYRSYSTNSFSTAFQASNEPPLSRKAWPRTMQPSL